MPQETSDTTELMAAYAEPAPSPFPPPAVDPAALRRAYHYGRLCRPRLAAWSFAQVESQLQAGWFENGEHVRWKDVRSAVQLGFEQPLLGE